jgi:RimJ/RimL family protein N-acetyltransferase
MPDYAIRDARPEDAADLIALRQAVFGETEFMLYGPGEYSASAAEVAEQLRRIGDSGHSRSLVAETSAGLIGFIGAAGSPVPRLRHSASLFLGVLRKHWGKGAGSAMLSQIIEWAPRAGLSRLELHVMTDNARAIALYERIGFRLEGSRRRAYVINGRNVDDLVMAYVYEA